MFKNIRRDPLVRKVGRSGFPLGDLVSRIKKASLLGSPFALVPYTSLNERILELLFLKGYLLGYTILKEERSIKVHFPEIAGRMVLAGISLLFTPSRSFHFDSKTLARKFGLSSEGQEVIVSTSKGIMTAFEACSKGLGGVPLILI